LLRRTRFILSHPIFKISVFHNDYTYSLKLITYYLLLITHYVVVTVVVVLVADEPVVMVSISDALDLPALFTA